jgi:hypothetical protein
MKNTMLRKSFKMLEKLQIAALTHSTPWHLPDFDFQVYTLLLMQIMDHRNRRHI